MKFYLSIFVFILTICNFTNNKINAQTAVDTVEIIKNLQTKFNYKGDTELLLHKNNTSVIRIKQKKTKLHGNLKKEFKNIFNEKNNAFTSKNIRFNKFVIPDNFLHTFVPVYKYKGDYFLYLPCDFQYSFRLTDSYLASSYMDGIYNYPILEFLKIHVNSIHIYTNIDQISYTIDVVDGEKNIYRLIRNDQFAGYFTPATNIDNFEIIAEDCDVKGAVFERNFEIEPFENKNPTIIHGK